MPCLINSLKCNHPPPQPHSHTFPSSATVTCFSGELVMGVGTWRWAGPCWVDEEIQCLSSNSDFVCMLHASVMSDLCKPRDWSPPGSSIRGILQARILSGLPFPSPGDLSNPGIQPPSLGSPELAGRFFTTSATWEAPVLTLPIFCSMICF